jgi:glyoxylase-like metal-dependent hydrolase (beta-lactamase superfamily II)
MARPRHVARGVSLFPARTPTLPPATHTNSYALGDREVLLVEPATPYEDERRDWIAWARALVSQGRRAVAIVLTHHHVDHVGGAEVFARELGLPLWAHEATAARLPELTVGRMLVEGEEITLAGATASRWRVLHTPGHAPGHVCLHEATTGTVVVGDMVASVGTILIPPGEGDMAEYLRQLGRLAELEAEVALPAHGEPIAKDASLDKPSPSPSELFRYYVKHRLGRETKVVEALEKVPEEGASLEALVPVVYADTPVVMWPVARMSLEAHLIKLEAEGRAKRAGEGWAKGG